MCGIIGTIINKKPLQQIRTVENLYAYQKNRGQRGYGMANVTRMKRIRSENLKGILGWEQYHFMKNFRRGDVLMFHHRMPTSTENTAEQAHPFFNENKTISLIHNGVISNDKKLHDDLVKEGHRFETEAEKGVYNDSEVILHQFEKALKEKGSVKKAMGELIKTLKGNYAIAIAFKGEHRTHLLTKNNPTTISSDENENYYFSSELKGVFTYKNCGIKEGETNEEGMQLIHDMEEGQYCVLDKTGVEIIKTFDIPKPEPTKKLSKVRIYEKATDRSLDWYYDHEQNCWVSGEDLEKTKGKRGFWTKGCRRVAGRFLEEVCWEQINDFDIWEVYTDLETTLFQSANLKKTYGNVQKLWNFFLGWLQHHKPYFYQFLQEMMYEDAEGLKDYATATIVEEEDLTKTSEELHEEAEKNMSLVCYEEKEKNKEKTLEEETIDSYEKEALNNLFPTHTSYYTAK